MAKRQCYYIPPDHSTFEPGNGFVPALVTEGEPGYGLMAGNGPFSSPWYWGMEIDAAKKFAEEANARDFGLTPEEAVSIVLSSMRAGR
jgi:hypothetical protein